VPRPEVLRALAALQERGLVVRLGRGRYDFVEPMFGEYVRRLDEGSLHRVQFQDDEPPAPDRASRGRQSAFWTGPSRR